MVTRYGMRTLFFAASLLLLPITMNVVCASEVEKWLLMPGDVITHHASIEAECSLCHAPLSDELQGSLCIDCHTDIGNDLTNLRGYHGSLSISEQLECASCHTDHEGRDTDIVMLDVATFDHALTDFTLQGAHIDASCESCHEADTAHREAPSQCLACHGPDDIHNGSLGDDCATCHVSDNWQQTVFDHSGTPFSLTGAHRDTACGACHRSPVFSEVGTTCVSCHQADDVHKGRNGSECASCHVTSDWARVTFDHFKLSGFPLANGHYNLTCNTCHRDSDYHDLGGSTCQSCHGNDDVHNGNFGINCANCHRTRDWSSTLFDHATQAGLALPPGHDQLTCDSCHIGKLEEPLPQDCGTCHRNDDPHMGQLGSECESCHAPTSWTEDVLFDHDITIFPLIGAHADIDCVSCHETAAFHDVDSACISCHVEDDLHENSLGSQCESCHNPSSWRAWIFNHETDTTFALTGAHFELACGSCHVSPADMRRPLSQECVSCHRRDDSHGGRFGDNCGSCHSTESFSQIGDR